MQTSQIVNPANISSPAPAAKQSDANSAAEPFGRVLSREMADRRSPNEAQAAGSRAAAAKTPSRNDGKPAPAKAAGDNQADAEAPVDIADSAALLPEELLSLVANLTQMNTATAESTEAQAALTQDVAQISVDPALVAAVASAANVAAAGTIPENHPNLQLTDPALPTTSGESRNLSKIESTLSALTAKAGDIRQQPDIAATDQSALSSTTSALELTAKTQEMLPRATTASAPDFATEVKEALTGITTGMQQAQPAALQSVQQAFAQSAEKLTPRVGTPAWDQALGQKVVWMVTGEQQSASLTLNPPDLGPLQVVLSVSNSQANATFIAAQPEVRQALEAALPKLRDMLGEAGIQLGQASVNSGTPHQHGAQDQHNPQSAHRTMEPALHGDAPALVSRVQPAASGQGLVDTFV